MSKYACDVSKEVQRLTAEFIDPRFVLLLTSFTVGSEGTRFIFQGLDTDEMQYHEPVVVHVNLDGSIHVKPDSASPQVFVPSNGFWAELASAKAIVAIIEENEDD